MVKDHGAGHLRAVRRPRTRLRRSGKEPQPDRRQQAHPRPGIELETNIVTTHIGVVPSDASHPRYRIMQDACGELAAYADGAQGALRHRDRPETAATLKGFLDTLHSTRRGRQPRPGQPRDGHRRRPRAGGLHAARLHRAHARQGRPASCTTSTPKSSTASSNPTPSPARRSSSCPSARATCRSSRTSRRSTTSAIAAS